MFSHIFTARESAFRKYRNSAESTGRSSKSHEISSTMPRQYLGFTQTAMALLVLQGSTEQLQRDSPI